jgi:uncharacterized membrane protein
MAPARGRTVVGKEPGIVAAKGRKLGETLRLLASVSSGDESLRPISFLSPPAESLAIRLEARLRSRAMSHETWIALHVLGVVVFLGNLIVTAVWKTLADYTRNPPVIAYAQRLVTLTDLVFTATGAALITVSGFVLASDWGGITKPTWLTVGFSLFAASAAIWLAILVPTQLQQARMSRAFAQGGAIPERYWRLALRWYVFGGIATALPLANIFIMALKP